MSASVPLLPVALGVLGPRALAMTVSGDTLVTRTIAHRDTLDWITGGVTLLALVLLVLLLIGLVLLVLAMRRGVREVSLAVHRLADDARPLVEDAQGMMTDLHGMVRQVRSDVERLSGAAGTVGDHMRDATDAAAGRLEELGETLDQLQDELESTVETASGALRGLRLALLGLLMGESTPRRPGTRRRRRERPRAAATSTEDDIMPDPDDPRTPDA